MSFVRWGLLSTARINRRVIPAIRASRRGKLTAVASRDLQKSKDYAVEWGIPQAFGSYEDMLASSEIDAVYISLPNHLHAEWSVRALDAGKHVLCEKPFALSVAEVDRMIDAQRRTGLVLQEAFMYRHHPQTKITGEWVKEGQFGEITLFRGIFSFHMGGNRARNVRLVPEFGGGSLWDVGIYPLSFAQFVFGQPPEWVVAQQVIGPSGVDETFSGLLAYPGGRSAQIVGGFHIPFHTAVEIHGTKGRFTINHPFTQMNESGREVLFTPAEGKPEKIHIPRLDPYLGEIENMQAAILDGKTPLISLCESRNHVRTAAALYRSAQTGQIVPLDEND